MQVVNGYVCQTSCDVAAAKKGHDPRNPHDDPVKAAQLAEAKGVVSGKGATGGVAGVSASGFSADAVTFGGALAGISSSAATASPTAQSLVNLVA